jgi:predicted transcriptional regulator
METKLDPDLTGRLQRLAAARHQTPDTLIREAIEQYLGREEKPHTESQHPSGKPWPKRTPVGGIITPV